MIPHLPSPSPFIILGDVLYWTVVMSLLIGSLVCSLVTLRRPRRILVYVASGLLALALVVVAVPGPQASVPLLGILGIVVVALATIGGGPAVQLTLALASHGTVSDGSFGGIMVANRDAAGQLESPHEVLRGGTTIGYLERVATAGSILAGFPAAIALVVAIKSVGRLSELNQSEARERFIIGTLVSLIWACASAAVFHFVTK